MISAFGVDHGEGVEKAFGMGALGSRIAGGTRTAANALGRGSAGLRRNVATNPSAIGGAKKRLGTVGGQAAGGLRRLGQGMAARPGLTGGVAAGGAAAGAGGIGMAAMNKPKRF